MEEEATESNESNNETAEAVETTTQEPAQKPGNPEREWVDPSIDPPEKVKERLDFLYGKVKKTEREQSEWRRLAADQAAVIEELRNGQGQIVNHLTKEAYADTEANLEEQISNAFQTGDTKAFLAAQNKLIDIKAQQKVAQITPRQQPQQQPNSASQIASQSQLPYEDQSAIDAWQGEMDERGTTIRPWALNTGTERNPDPDYMKAILVARNVYEQLPHLTTTQKLAEIDKRMGTKKTAGAQNVMGGGLTSKAKTGRITLTPQTERLAVRTKFGGPKAKSDAEHIEAYRKQIEKVRSKGAK